MIRPVDAEISQHFGDNPTRYLAPSNPLILAFGNYQPDGHTGEDYACQIGTPVHAVTDGTVLHIGWMGGGYADNPWWVMPSFAGYCAVIDHGSFVGIYGHCSDGSAKVSKGDRVSEGQVFILSGNTGGSTGPHLHFEILPDRWVLNSTFYGRTDPEALFSGSLSLASQSTTPAAPAVTETSQEDFMGGQIDAQQAEDIVNAVVQRVVAALDNQVRINAVQAESIVQATTARTAALVDANANGKTINAQQADDIAQAAANYNQAKDEALYNKDSK